MTKKVLSIILSALLLAAIFGGCQKSEKNESGPVLITEQAHKVSTDTTSFKLSYSQSDSLNPYKSQTLNNQVVQDLVFESLFTLDENFNAVPCIATSYTYTDSTTLRVTMPKGITFSDGSRLTATSVVNAFEEAQKSPRWKNNLAPISSASKVSDTEIDFHLKYADPLAHQLLNFAVSKTKDGEKYPIGSGRYKLGEGDGKVYLELNENYREEFSPSFSQIRLINITTTESIDNALNIGNISFAYRDLAQGTPTGLECNKKPVNINNLVYLGLNSNNGITANEDIRRAISLAIDRDTIVKSAYQGYGKSAISVYSPVSKIGRETQMFTPEADTNAAKQAVAKSSIAQNKLKLRLIVSKNPNRVGAAKFIKQQLEAAGFTVEIKSLSEKAFKNELKYNNYNIYIGETKIPSDMRLTSFFSKKGATNFGINQKGKSAQSYTDYLNGKAKLGKFAISFTEEIPFVPLLYRQGMICYSKAMHGDVHSYAGSYFANIEDWYYN